jgi:hypothetical protein
MDTRYLSIPQASSHYGGTVSAWRKWVAEGSLGNSICRFGRLVMIDTATIDDRLQQTGQLLVKTPGKCGSERAKGPRCKHQPSDAPVHGDASPE